MIDKTVTKGKEHKHYYTWDIRRDMLHRTVATGDRSVTGVGCYLWNRCIDVVTTSTNTTAG